MTPGKPAGEVLEPIQTDVEAKSREKLSRHWSGGGAEKRRVWKGPTLHLQKLLKEDSAIGAGLLPCVLVGPDNGDDDETGVCHRTPELW